MSEMLEFYQKQAQKGLSTIPWLAALQSKASLNFMQSGFPGRRDEEWKYTRLDSLLAHEFTPPTHEAQDVTKAPSNLPIANQIVIHNGRIICPDWVKNRASGVVICSLADALVHHAELVRTYLGSALSQEHAFHFLNTALIQSGVLIYIPKGVCLDEPIALVHHQDQMHQATYLRHLIIMEPGSQATLIEEYNGEAEICYMTNKVTEVIMQEQAMLTHYTVQRESKQAYHLGHLAVKQKAHSHFSNHSISLGGALVRSDISLYLEGEKAHCLLNGIYSPTAGQHVDHHTTVLHQVPNCSSEQDYKGILSGKSRAVFNGKVIVAKDAQHTDAKQQNKNLLLSSQAEIDTKPQLEIFADDVSCTHGATVGQLDEDALFYLATRGIGRKEATQYLIHAFAQNNLRLISHEELAQWMRHLLIEHLE